VDHVKLTRVQLWIDLANGTEMTTSVYLPHVTFREINWRGRNLICDGRRVDIRASEGESLLAFKIFSRDLLYTSIPHFIV